MPLRVMVIGGGPMGLAAGLGAIARGYETTILEATEIGSSLRGWGQTRFFTPLSMNVSRQMGEVLGTAMPDRDALLTAAEYVDDVLRPLADRDPLRGRVRTQTRVVAIGRRGLTRVDYAGHPLRAEKPFLVLTDHDETIEADVVLDATGSNLATPFGASGIPARGEAAVNAIRTLGQLAARKSELRGRRVLLVGHGHSAANAIAVLRDAGAEVTWAARTANRRPCEEIANDPLPERRRVVSVANDLATQIRVERRAMVEKIERNGALQVTLTGGRIGSFDAIAAFTGYRPDGRHISELTVETSPVTEGGGRLYRAVSKITDCLSVPRVSPADLQSGEPNFFFIGARSYGRARTFLLQTGLQQLETILDSLPR